MCVCTCVRACVRAYLAVAHYTKRLLKSVLGTTADLEMITVFNWLVLVEGCPGRACVGVCVYMWV